VLYLRIRHVAEERSLAASISTGVVPRLFSRSPAEDFVLPMVVEVFHLKSRRVWTPSLCLNLHASRSTDAQEITDDR
jgi:hypothetical protein